ncbi:MAG: glycosyltransferase [Paludibacteraceae bacterium]
MRWKELIDSIRESELYKESIFIFYEKNSSNLYSKETVKKISKSKIMWKKFYTFLRIMDYNTDINEKFIFHSSYYRVCSNKNAFNIITFHDCIQELFGKGIRNYFTIKMKKRIIKKADHIICNSHTTRNDLISLYRCDQNKVSVIYSGVNPVFQKIDNIEKNNHILFVGSRASYKKFDFVIELLKDNENLNLTIVGGGKIQQART